MEDVLDIYAKELPEDEIVICMDESNKQHIKETKEPIPEKFYEYFEPQTARRLIEKFEFHFTPKHASWLNMAEIEFSVLFKQALDKRIPNQETLKKEIKAWQDKRNANTTTIDWKFTTKDARIEIKTSVYGW